MQIADYKGAAALVESIPRFEHLTDAVRESESRNDHELEGCGVFGLVSWRMSGSVSGGASELLAKEESGVQVAVSVEVWKSGEILFSREVVGLGRARRVGGLVAAVVGGVLRIQGLGLTERYVEVWSARCAR